LGSQIIVNYLKPQKNGKEKKSQTTFKPKNTLNYLEPKKIGKKKNHKPP